MSNTSRREFLGAIAGAAGAVAVTGGLASAARFTAIPAAGDGSELVAKAIGFLRGRQAADGSWSSDKGEPGITALVAAGLLRSGQVLPDEPIVAKALAYLETFLGPDGGFTKARHTSYTTSVGLVAFHAANKGGRYDRLIASAEKFLRATQFDETHGTKPTDPYYGGAGYGPDGQNPPRAAAKDASKKAAPRAPRPDLSNTAFMLEALHTAGVPSDDPAYKRAMVFISRCQNLKGEFNDQPWADKINDGGFIYTVANGGTSIAGKSPEGYPLSYGSMTYAALKSMIYAGLTPEDPRYKAALGYIRRTYSLDQNPGAGDRALYYYYTSFAKALAVLGDRTLVDDKGAEHDWRADLTAALAKRQGQDGSWVNTNDRFMEGDANLVTAYALIALGHARQAKS